MLVFPDLTLDPQKYPGQYPRYPRFQRACEICGLNWTDNQTNEPTGTASGRLR